MNGNNRNSDNKNGSETHRERYIPSQSSDIADARKKKVQSFKLNIDDDWFSETTDKSKAEDESVTKRDAFIIDENTAAHDDKPDDVYYGRYALQDDYGQEPDVFEETDEEEIPEAPEEINSFSDEEQRQKMSREERLALKSYKKSEKKRKKLKAEKNGCMFRLIWLAMVVVVAVVLGMFVWNDFSDLLGISRPESESTVDIELPEDASIDQVVEVLEQNGLISRPDFFKLYAQLTKSTTGFKGGFHSMKTNMDYEAILNSLQSGKALTETVQIQFKEGLSVRECAEILEEKKVCKADKFMELCNSDTFDEEYDFIAAIPDNDLRTYKLEGYLFPDTYDFYIGEDAEDSVRRFLNNFKEKIFTEKKKYDQYTEEKSIADIIELDGKKLDDIINMASLVQAEAADEKDMYVVSSVFYNRLDTVPYDGINEYGDGELDKLKSDATLYYPYKSEDDIPVDLRSTFKSNYNTYNISGMPPGAICNPGISAIDAAINPDDTNYYYFCHKAATPDSPAKAYYATTYDEHQANEREAGLTTE